MTLSELLVPNFIQLLKALSAWLTKAQSQMLPAQAEALLSARLADDMFPLSTQIRFACVQALEAPARLTGLPFPDAVAELLAEGRDAGDQPGTIADAQARIAETLATLERLAPGTLAVSGPTPIAHALPNGMTFDLTADQYARDWAVAQFNFHLMTAYAILRSKGIALGKADYIPHLLPYLRANTKANA